MVEIELEPEVEGWIRNLSEHDYATVAIQIERLEELGSTVREPWSKHLGDGLYELRFNLRTVSWRISYYFAPNRRVVLLTVFRKQRQNERREVTRARQAMRRCLTEHDHEN